MNGIAAQSYIEKCTPHAQRILSLVIRTIHGLIEKSIPSPDESVTTTVPYNTDELLFGAALHLQTSAAHRFLLASGIPNISDKIESFLWDRYRFLLEMMATVEEQKVFDVDFEQCLKYVDENCAFTGLSNIRLHLIDADDYFEWACADSPGRGQAGKTNIDTRHLILSILADCACCPCGPTRTAMAISPSNDLYFALRYLKRFPAELEFTKRHLLGISYTKEGFNVGLLANHGTFTHLGNANSENQLEPSLFVGCKPPLFLETELTSFLEIINEERGQRERHIQDFLESHSHFLRAFGLTGYRPQVQLITSDPLESNSKASLRVDFLGRMIAGDSSAIIELKRGMNRFVVGPQTRRRHAAELNMALRQLEEYHEFFEDRQNRRWFTERYGEEIFRPELILLMGHESVRKLAWGGFLKTPVSGLPVRVITYQDILNLIRIQHLVLPSTGYNLE